MYLYKYLFKGPDYTQFQLIEDGSNKNEVENEFKDYIHGRYLSSSEAVWRIFNFHITQQLPTVKALRVHLPNQELSQMYRKNTISSGASQLLRYFCRPSNQLFDNLLYSDYFSQYILYPYKLAISSTPVSQWTENCTGEDVNHKFISPMVIQKRKGK